MADDRTATLCDVHWARIADLDERLAALEARVVALEAQASRDRLRAERLDQRARLSYVAETLMNKTDVPGGVRVSSPGCGASEFFKPDVVPVVLHLTATCPVLLRLRAAEEVMLDTTEVHA